MTKFDNLSRKMESGYHFKNEAKMKKQKSRKIFMPAKIILMGLLLFVCEVKLYGQNNIKSHPAEPEMILVEGGTFMMGRSERERDCENLRYTDISNEQPAHQVTVSSFYIGKFEVTQGQWKSLMGKEPPSSTKGDNYPADLVTWNAAQDFINRLNALTGKNYRLPTESEWEYAARGGTKSKGYKYSGSNNLADVAWFRENSGMQLYPVGQKQSNELGIYDMTGNVWEYCSDWAGGVYTADAQMNPKGLDSGTRRVQRGGSWSVDDPCLCRVVYRGSSSPDEIVNRGTYGFRLVLPVE